MSNYDSAERELAPAAVSSTIGIGRLSIKRPSLDDPTPAEDGFKGGKGGEGGAPPLPPSNAVFLNAVICDVGGTARAAVCSKQGDPTQGGWYAVSADDVDRQCPADRNNFFNCSSFSTIEGDAFQARKDRFSGFHVIVLDDVGTKVDRTKLGGLEPTWEIETSPGNSQVGYRLATPIRDAVEVKQLQDAIMAAELCDPGAGGLARWVRLPNAVNGKPKYSVDGKPFDCRLMRWNPEAAYSIDELVIGLGLELDTARESISHLSYPAMPSAALPMLIDDDVFTPAPTVHPVVKALKERQLYKRETEPGKHEITCPWVSEHTDGVDSGSVYFEPDSARPIGGYKCQHSHGADQRIGQLLKFLDVEGDDARGKARIRLVAGEINRIRGASELALTLYGSFYQAGGAIVSIREDARTGDVAEQPPSGGPVLLLVHRHLRRHCRS